MKNRLKHLVIGMAGVGIIASAVGVAIAGQHSVTDFAGQFAEECGSTPKVLFGQKISTKKEASNVTIHYKWEGSQPHIYYSNIKTKEATTYPGVPMKDEGNGWYSYTVSTEDALSMIINVPEVEYQTTEFSREPGEYWYDMDLGWSKEIPDNYELPEATKEPEASNTEVAQQAPMKEVVMDESSDLAVESNIIVHYAADNFSSANIYGWNALPNDIEMAWPGEAASKDNDGYFTYVFRNVSKVNFLFHDDKVQTEDFSLKQAGEYWYVNGEWTTTKPEGSGDHVEVTTAPTVTDAPQGSTGPAPTPGSGIEVGTGKTASFADTRTDFRDESIYFLMTTRFYDGDSGNNSRGSHDDDVKNPPEDPSWRGDFKGLIEKLDYIKALGFTSVWITPVVENKSRSGYDYHGYHAYNFKNVDSRYLSNGVGYQDLINACHEKGLKIIQDIVLNHSGGYGEANLQTLSTNAEGSIAGQDPGNVFNHGYIKSWESYDVQTTSIDGDCIDLNTENTRVIDYLKEAYDQYINMGVDGFRIDTMKHISRLTFNNEFAPHFNETAKSAGTSNFYMFGEVCARDENALYFNNWACISAFFYTWAEKDSWAWGDSGTNATSVKAHFTKYQDYGAEKAKAEFNSDNAFLNGNEYHKPDYSINSGMGVIDFPMHWSFRNANNAYNRALQDDAYYNDATWNVVYVDSHDYGPNTMEKIRYKEGTEAWAENLDLLFTFRGIPCIYYGSEVEFQAGKTIDGFSQKISETGRAYFGDNIEGGVTASDFGEFTASGTVKETLNKPLALHLQTLNKIRQAVPALRKGQYSTDGCNGNMAFKRRYTDGNIDSFACVAISGDATFSGIPGGTYTDCVTGDTQTVAEGGTLSVSCAGKGNLRVYVLDTAKTKAPGKVGEGSAYLK